MSEHIVTYVGQMHYTSAFHDGGGTKTIRRYCSTSVT